MGPNRHNKRKQKKGCGCKMCKAHKGKWQPFHKKKFRQKMIEMQEIVKDYFKNTCIYQK